MKDDRPERLAKARSVKPRGRPKARLCSINELAEYLSVSRRTIYRLLDSKGLPHLRVGYVLRFDLPEVLTWLKEFTERGDRLLWVDDYPELKRGERRVIKTARKTEPVT